MMDMLSETQWVALIGLGGGILLGLAARLGRFCTLGAIEDVLYGGSDVRLRLWGVAIGVAIMGSFGLISVGALDARQSYYLSVPWMPMASILGGLTFGYGMALAGNCGFGAIARLGGGDLRSFVIVLVMGVSAYGVLNGPLAPLRTWLFPQGTLIGDIPPGVAHTVAHATGAPLGVVGLLIGLLVLSISLGTRRVWAAPGPLIWAVVVGLAIVSGWAGTQWVAARGFDGLPVVSHSFSAPVGEAILWTMTGSARPLSFAMGSVAGVWCGACIGSLIKGHFRWEACDDPRELRRQIFGAGLMGMGAIVALGCTVGQGITALSVLAYSGPVTFVAIFVGAAIGLRHLIEGFRPAQ